MIPGDLIPREHLPILRPSMDNWRQTRPHQVQPSQLSLHWHRWHIQQISHALLMTSRLDHTWMWDQHQLRLWRTSVHTEELEEQSFKSQLPLSMNYWHRMSLRSLLFLVKQKFRAGWPELVNRVPFVSIQSTQMFHCSRQQAMFPRKYQYRCSCNRRMEMWLPKWR